MRLSSTPAAPISRRGPRGVAPYGRIGGDSLDLRRDHFQRRAQSVPHVLRVRLVEVVEADDQAAPDRQHRQELADGAPDQFFIRPQLRCLEQCEGAERVERNHFRHHLPAVARKDGGWR